MSKILYINNNNFHNLGRSQMCAGGCCYFRPSKPHSGTLCDICPLGDGDGTQAVGGDGVACVDHGLVSSLSLCFLCSEEGGDGDQDGDPIRLVMPGIEARPVPHSPDT